MPNLYAFIIDVDYGEYVAVVSADSYLEATETLRNSPKFPHNGKIRESKQITPIAQKSVIFFWVAKNDTKI